MRTINAIEEEKRKKNEKSGIFLHFIFLILEGGKKADVAAFVNKLGSSVGRAGWS